MNPPGLSPCEGRAAQSRQAPARRRRSGRASGRSRRDRRRCLLQPYGMEAATLWDGGCNPMRWRLQPYAPGRRDRRRGLPEEAQRPS
eukprot:scaffold24981_cov47-Phaeocystis_antarctica.AAC.1